MAKKTDQEREVEDRERTDAARKVVKDDIDDWRKLQDKLRRKLKEGAYRGAR